MTSVTEHVTVLLLSVMAQAVAMSLFDRAFALCCLEQLKDTLCISLYCMAQHQTLTFTYHQCLVSQLVC